MRQSVIGPIVLVTILVATPLVLGAGPAADPSAEPGGATGEVLLPERALPSRALSPKMTAIQAVLKADRERVAELQQQLNAATDETEALRLLRAIHDHKQDTEIAILQIQERFAREAGDTETADKIKLAVDEILRPPVPAARAEAKAESAARRSGGSGHE
jgi:TolA-binding protein